MYLMWLLLALVAAVAASNYQDLLKEEWQAFKLEHEKVYNDRAEDHTRLKIYLNNRLKIAKHNQLYANGTLSYSMGLNRYSDLEEQEFDNTMNGFKYSAKNRVNGITFITPANVNIAETVDWRTEGAVTPVKNQGQCGSCWAFSSTGALEGQHFRKTGQLISLSEQNLVDCNRANGGCNGGYMNYAFMYVRDNKGIDTEDSYPYKAVNDNCHFDKSHIGATDVGYVDIPHGSEQKLMEAVATIGPIAVAIHATASFQQYRSGVYIEPNCNPNELNHAVLIVGYATDEQYGDYWLVKNSWSTSWGDSGYIKMARNRNNQCGIANMASYPAV